MSKRSRRPELRLREEWNQGDDLLLPSDCDSDDWEPTAKKVKVVKNSSKKKSTAAKKTMTEGQTREAVHKYTAVLEVKDSLHSRSRHSIRTAGALRTALLRWFATVKDARGMPWRKSFDFSQGPEERSQRAYEVWVSEVMLQQTQVATVIPYYNRWMETFPTLEDLVSQISLLCACYHPPNTAHEARANVDQVNALWKGLGYYSRARRLLEGAKKVSKEYGGRLPDNAGEMQQMIPGIGRYSAGAICSIAYGERVPVLDGNVHRLLSRLLALHAPPKSKATLDILWDAAGVMVQEDKADETQMVHPGDINQALIELGSTVCKARDPSCNTCPLQMWCFAYKLSSGRGTSLFPDIEDVCSICEPLPRQIVATTFPMKVVRKKAREELDIVNVIEWRSDMLCTERSFLLVRRPDSGLLAGLYDFVTSVDVSKNISPKAVEAASIKLVALMFRNIPLKTTRLYSDTGYDSDMGKRLTVKPFIARDVTHTFSHIKKTYRVVWVLMTGGNNPPEYCPDISVDDSSDNVEKNSGGGAFQKNVGGNSDSLMDSKWVSLNQVAEANIGTGSMKVWNAAKDFWEKSVID